jgi:hypothetical protein
MRNPKNVISTPLRSMIIQVVQGLVVEDLLMAIGIMVEHLMVVEMETMKLPGTWYRSLRASAPYRPKAKNNRRLPRRLVGKFSTIGRVFSHPLSTKPNSAPKYYPIETKYKIIHVCLIMTFDN